MFFEYLPSSGSEVSICTSIPTRWKCVTKLFQSWSLARVRLPLKSTYSHGNPSVPKPHSYDYYRSLKRGASRRTNYLRGRPGPSHGMTRSSMRQPVRARTSKIDTRPTRDWIGRAHNMHSGIGIPLKGRVRLICIVYNPGNNDWRGAVL